MFFPYHKEIVKTSNSTKVITKSRESLYNTTKINFCEPEREIGLTIVTLEHQEARGVAIEGEWVFYMRRFKENVCLG